MLRVIFGTDWESKTGEWRKLGIKELHELYCSPYVVRGMKSRHMWWKGHVYCMVERRSVFRGLM